MRDGNGAFPIADTKEKDLAMIAFATVSIVPAMGVELLIIDDCGTS